jgi:hypothetical protein
MPWPFDAFLVGGFMHARSATSAFTIGLLILVAGGATLLASNPSRRALEGWTRYVDATETRMSREIGAQGPFLAIDAASAATARRDVLGGKTVTSEVETRDDDGHDIDVPDALVHHWRGDVLLAGARLADVATRLETSAPPAPPDDVLRSAVIDRGPGWIKVGLTLQRKKFITVVYATEHLVTFKTIAPGRVVSESIATKIAELADPGTPRQREVGPDDDHGFLWRWNVYWRYEQTPRGVLAECESISLSRDVPALLRLVAGPLIESTARESMEKALTAMRAAFEITSK